MGGSAFVLLMLAEAVLSVTLFHRSIEEHFRIYTSLSGAAGLAGQIVFGILPLARLGCEQVTGK